MIEPIEIIDTGNVNFKLPPYEFARDYEMDKLFQKTEAARWKEKFEELEKTIERYAMTLDMKTRHEFYTQLYDEGNGKRKESIIDRAFYTQGQTENGIAEGFDRENHTEDFR